MKTLDDKSPPLCAGVDASSHPQTAKFMDWYKAEQKNGLVDIKFLTGDLDGATLESFFTEVNSAISAETLSDKEIF